MNFIDIAILLILAITILGGLYRGFVSTALNVERGMKVLRERVSQQ